MGNLIVNAVLTAACVFLATALYWTGKPVRQQPGSTSSTLSRPYAAEDDLALLDQPVGDMQLENISFQEALITLSDRTRINIDPHWPEIEKLGISRIAAVQLHISHATLGQALTMLIHSLATRTSAEEIGFTADNGIVVISSTSYLARDTVTDCINIRTLLEDIARVHYSLGEARGTPVPQPGRPAIPVEDEIDDQIIKLITDSVAPDSWRDSGGTVGSLREIGGVLVITQTRENLRDIHLLLNRLHAAVARGDLSALAAKGPAATEPTKSQ